MIRDTRWLLALFATALVSLSTANCASNSAGDEEDPPSDVAASVADGEGAGEEVASGAEWWSTCGDPACGGHTPTADVLACADQVEGQACADGDAPCDPGNGCNSHLVCASADPAVDCPVSLRSAKRNIAYLTPPQLEEVRQTVVGMPLATWHYKRDAHDRPLRLGFIIEDVTPAPSVNAAAGQVDLYGYTSMAVAAIQVQEHELRALRSQLEAVRAEVDRLTGQTARR